MASALPMLIACGRGQSGQNAAPREGPRCRWCGGKATEVYQGEPSCYACAASQMVARIRR
jgi:hypothetical protein